MCCGATLRACGMTVIPSPRGRVFCRSVPGRPLVPLLPTSEVPARNRVMPLCAGAARVKRVTYVGRRRYGSGFFWFSWDVN